MTERVAKNISLEIWGYLKDHPEKCGKKCLPSELYFDIKGMDYECPLCEIFPKCPIHTDIGIADCSHLCPLFPCTKGDCFMSQKNCKYPNAYWEYIVCPESQRKQHAEHIYELIEEWEPHD